MTTRNIHPRYHKTYLSRMRTADWLLSACWITIAIVIAVFLADGGLKELKTTSGFWIAMGQLTGLVATDLLLVQLLLASRLPWIDRAFGHDRAMLLHRKLGKPILYLLLAHGVTLTIGYGLPLSHNIFLWITGMLALPDIWFAVLGLVLLMAIVITSLTIVRKRLDYDLWFIIHLLAYVAIIAAIPHQFSEGAIFANGTYARYYWIALYGVTALSVLVFRFIKPLVASLRHSLYVDSVISEGPDAITLHIKGRDIQKLQASAGQFLMWRFWTQGLWWQAHPFSLSSSPVGKNYLRVTIRSLGNGSEKILKITPGTRVSIEGPYGLFTEKTRTSKNIILAASGIGVTPIKALMEEIDFADGEATLILRKSQGNVIYLYDEILTIAKQRGIRVFVIEGSKSNVAPTWLSANAVSQGVNLATFSSKIRDSDIYVCGPSGWTDSFVKEALSLGVGKHQLHWERFNW